jgi:hypothetical protein
MLRTGVTGYTSFNVTVLPDQESPFKIDLEKRQKIIDSNLQVKIKSMDLYGVLRLQFSKPLFQIANIS